MTSANSPLTPSLLKKGKRRSRRKRSRGVLPRNPSHYGKDGVLGMSPVTVKEKCPSMESSLGRTGGTEGVPQLLKFPHEWGIQGVDES